MSVKNWVGDRALGSARAWIRYSPFQVGKTWLWDRMQWRHKKFRCRTTFGAEVTGHTQDLIQRYLYYFGVWEPEITHIVIDRLKPNDCFIDVGANIGYYSLLASRLVGSGGRVVAIEAAPWIHEIASTHIRMNGFGNVRMVLAAASDASGTIKLYPAGPLNIGQTSTLARPSVQPLDVIARPMCEILTEQEVATARLIKIDVEGAELRALEGLAPILHKFRKDMEILMEVTQTGSPESAEEAKQIFTIMTAHGFTAYQIHNDYRAAGYLKRSSRSTLVKVDSPPDRDVVDLIFSRG